MSNKLTPDHFGSVVETTTTHYYDEAGRPYQTIEAVKTFESVQQYEMYVEGIDGMVEDDCFCDECGACGECPVEEEVTPQEALKGILALFAETGTPSR